MCEKKKDRNFVLPLHFQQARCKLIKQLNLFQPIEFQPSSFHFISQFDHSAFFNNTLQSWDPPTFRGFFGLLFSTKRIFGPTVLLLKKAARCPPFLALVRCLFHNHLRLKRSVYLHCKFEISLLTSHLFFSLFKMKNKIFLHINTSNNLK